MSQVGKNIKKIRKVRGLSQQAFADLFELTRGNISSYEEFRAEPKTEMIVRIANFFGIPLSDFIEKDLSVNKLLHYNTELATSPEKLKMAQQLVKVPYVPGLYIEEYLKRYADVNFMMQLPHIIIPDNSKFELIAFEIDNPEILPAGFNYHNGDVLIFEKILKENMHRIIGRLGLMIGEAGLQVGIYRKNDAGICLELNEWVNYPFDMESESQYWSLRGTYLHII